MLLFMDGQAHYSTAQLGRKWTYTDPYETWTIVNEGRWSSNPCIKRVAIDDVSPPGYLLKGPIMTQGGAWTAASTGVCGFAFKTEDLSFHREGQPGSGAADGGILKILEGSSVHLVVYLNPDGSMSLYRMPPFGAMTLLGTSLVALFNNTWAYVEFKWTIDDPGAFAIRVNGLEVLTYTGRTISDSLTDTYTSVWTSVRVLEFRSSEAPDFATCWMNDFYLLDQNGSGDELRDFLGDVKILCIRPNGVGTHAAWTPNTGANWAAVDDTPADDDTTYVSTSAANTRDSHTFEDIPTNVTVLGFQTCHLSKRATPGSAELKPTVRSGGTTHDGNSQSVASDTVYSYALQPYDTNPVTEAQATAAEINAAEFGTLYV
jgi:hypothetical protein